MAETRTVRFSSVALVIRFGEKQQKGKRMPCICVCRCGAFPGGFLAAAVPATAPLKKTRRERSDKGQKRTKQVAAAAAVAPEVTAVIPEVAAIPPEVVHAPVRRVRVSRVVGVPVPRVVVGFKRTRKVRSDKGELKPLAVKSLIRGKGGKFVCGSKKKTVEELATMPENELDPSRVYGLPHLPGLDIKAET